MGLYLGDKLIASILAGGDTNPIGSVIAFAGSNAPVGYLMCDGSAVSRETYAELFVVIGTTYGSGDGSTTFNLPGFKEEYRKLLWENPNPSAGFASQTIDLDLSRYDEVEIKFNYNNTSNIVVSGKGKLNEVIRGCLINGSTTSGLYISGVYRDGTVTNNGITFTTGSFPRNGGFSTSNDYMVPVKIYGIKETTPVIKTTHNVTIQGVDTMSEAEYQDLIERLV